MPKWNFHELATPLFRGYWGRYFRLGRLSSSNPLSWVLRPIAAHPRLRLGMGLGLVVLTAWLSLSDGAVAIEPEDVGGPAEVIVLGTEESGLKTTAAVRKPVEKVEVSQKFWGLHSGLDLRAPIGTPVWAAMEGRVVQAENTHGGYGKLVVISHGNGYESWYGHLSKIAVNLGQAVDTQTKIGEVGSTGRSTGPHLHVEIRENGRIINPAPILGIKNVEGATQ